MITPIFSVEQTERTLILSIRAPHSRPKDIQLSADSHQFHFYTSPYLLHLRFEHPVSLPGSVDPSQPPAHTAYSLETGVATVTLHKVAPYPHFARLDMLSTLLVSHAPDRRPPSIEVVSTSSATAPPAPTARSAAGLELPLRELTIGRPTYGFAARYEGVFAVRADDAAQILDLRDPDATPVWRRPSLRKAAEDAKFCPHHYIADYLLQHEFQHVLDYRYAPPDAAAALADAHVDALLKLPRREYLPHVHVTAKADLAGLLFAALYDGRVTLGETCVETAWTVSRVCATTAFLESFKRPRDAIVAAFRRSLTYPLYRNYALAECVLRDLKALVGGCDVNVLRSRLLRVLLNVRDAFEDDNLLRLHCDLFLIDYCVWIQTVEDAVLETLQEEVLAVAIERHEMEWDLDALEARAKKMQEGGQVEEEPESLVAAETKEDVSGKERLGGADGKNQITISALSSYPSQGFEMVPVTTRQLNPDKRQDNEEVSTSSYEYESSYESTTS